jgi:hypothetical protein
MKSITFADTEYAAKRKQPRKVLFPVEVSRVVPLEGR